MRFLREFRWVWRGAAACGAGLLWLPQSLTAQGAGSSTLPEAPAPRAHDRSYAAGVQAGQRAQGSDSIAGTPARVWRDEVGIVTSPARVRRHDLLWLVPLAGASAAAFATDTHTMRDVVSRDGSTVHTSNQVSDRLRDGFLAAPAVLFGVGALRGDTRTRDTGLFGLEALADAGITGYGVKLSTWREPPYVQDGRGHFYQRDAGWNSSFVSGHSILAWSSAAVLAGQYHSPWAQAGVYTLAGGVSITRILGQDHFPSDVLLGSAAGWLIGRYVYRTHLRGPR